MNEEIKNAVVELENWLSDPQELGKKPVKIEYANSFEDEDGIRCIIFKYKKNILISHPHHRIYLIYRIKTYAFNASYIR